MSHRGLPSLSMGRLVPSAIWAWLLVVSCLNNHVLAAGWDCANKDRDGRWVCGSKSPLAPPLKTQEAAESGVELGEEPSSEAPDDPLNNPDSGDKTGAEDRPGLLTKKTGFTAPTASGDPEKARASGWNCEPGMDSGPDRGWSCTLNGRDPRGFAHVVSEPGEETEHWAESPNMTREDEERFESLMGKLPVNPWVRSCAPKVGRKAPPPLMEYILTPEERLARDKAPVDIHSDFFELLGDEVTNFKGSTEMIRADQHLWADYITRNLKTDAVNAHGNVFYQDKTMIMASDSGFMDGKAGRGVYRNTQFMLPSVPGRGTSRVTHIDSGTLSRYEMVSYTTCPTGNQDWVMHADHVKMNKESGTATARNAWFEFMDIPMFWAPYMEFPTDGRRVSGFLTPTMGSAPGGGGGAFSVPYYFNIAPNLDYTVEPRYLTKRGFQLRNEFRYLTDTSQGRVIGEIVPEDTQTHTTRGRFGLRDDSRFSEDVTAHVDANWVSDPNYLNQFGSLLSQVDYRNVASIAQVNYNSPYGLFNSTANFFQTIDPSTPKTAYPYFYLPKLEHAVSDNLMGSGLIFSNQTQVADLQADSNQMTTGQRFLIRPKVSYPMENSFGFVKPSATFAFNQYTLQNTEYWQQIQKTAKVDTQVGSSQTLAVPILSLDSGTYFDNEISLGDKSMQQTIEPRLFYVYIPKSNQENIPLFDTQSYDFTYYQLFRENRYAGYDRVGDANDLTAAVTSRLIDQTTGVERVRATLGNLAYFSNRSVTTIGPAPDTYSQSFSNIIGDLYTAITDDWSVYSAGQYNASLNRIQRGQVGIQYNNRQNQILNVAYRYRTNQNYDTCAPNQSTSSVFTNNDGCLNLTDVSMRLPILAGWYAIGRWEYSFLNNTTLESFVGFERETCCWKFALIGRRFLNTINSDGTATASNAFFVQLELKGLTSLNNDVDTFLQRSINGYRYQDY